ncbi:MAG: cell filamentation protein Fic, partial [Bdellovibrionaceae bacterium]|nr:cell filamentation protein Fic [Pseudobdellovibrionaceae bacterium]
MARQNKMLAQALSTAKALSKKEVVKSGDLARGVRERLVHAGYLEEVMRGWYLLTTPTGKGTTSLWFSSFWTFIEQYLKDRFGSDYCLSPESSVEFHCGQTTSPRQLQALTKQPSNTVVQLLHDTSLVLTTDKNFPEEVEKLEGINVMPLAHAICRLSPGYFAQSSLSVEIAFKLISSASDLSRILLESGSVASANRIAGVFKKMGEAEKSEQIVKDMAAAGYTVVPTDPFAGEKLYLRDSPRLTSPYVGRITAMWKKMREDIVSAFPNPEEKIDKRNTLKIIEQLYKQDAYHSLSIEGYQVTEEMIAKIAAGTWNPDVEKQDSEQRNAMAAKGYLQAFGAVCNSVKNSLNGKDAAVVLEEDLQNWYRELFAPSIQAQLLKPAQLAGYRNSPVYIKGSLHVPLP